MFNLQQEKVKEKLAAIGFDKLVRTSGFDTKYKKKISAFAFLFGFMKMYSARHHSLRAWASCIGSIIGERVSKQAVDHKFTMRHASGLEAVLQALMHKQYQCASLQDDFGQVLVQDSTCWSLPVALARHFPGSHSKTGIAATARLQVCYDIKGNRFKEFTLQSFRDNDQKHAASVLQWADKGDLVIRDLGYFKVGVLRDLAEKGAFFVSRLFYRVALYDKEHKRLSLGKLIKGRRRIDLPVLLGLEHKMPVRLIGIKLPPAKANQRRRRAKLQKDYTGRKDYLQFLGWSFFITNLAHHSADDIDRFYRLRWRIEMIFKGFKSMLNWPGMFGYASYERTLVTLYAMLIYVLLCWCCYKWCLKHNPAISLLKFLSWYHLHYEQIMMNSSMEDLLPHVLQHCQYERRHKRENYAQLTNANVSIN